jgi:ureidoacrylate peracid hydrolase
VTLGRTLRQFLWSSCRLGGKPLVDFAVVPERTALINVDFQNCFVDATPDGRKILDRVNQLARTCRSAGILVVHTRHALRPDGSNLGVLGELIPKIKEGVLNEDAESAALHQGLVVDPHDLVLDKPRFHGTDLEQNLNERGIDTVIISGISTPVCCDTTAREAMARDFLVLFLSDGTATAGSEAAPLQKATLEIVRDTFAQVLTVEEMRQKISRAVGAP